MSFWDLTSFIGLGAALSFGQTHKRVSSGLYADICGILIIPCVISILWSMSLVFSWWTIAIFLVMSLVVGFINGTFLRSGFGMESLVSMQPILGTTFVVCGISSWWPAISKLI